MNYNIHPNDDATLQVRYRTIIDTDRPFILSSMLKSYKSALDQTITFENWAEIKKAQKNNNKPHIKARLDYKTYHPAASALFNSLLTRCGALILCEKHDWDHILGYIVAEYLEDTVVVHWIYIKSPLRRNGLGKALLKKVAGDRTILATFQTPRALELSHKYPHLYDMSLLTRLFKHEAQQIDIMLPQNEYKYTSKGAAEELKITKRSIF